MDAHPLLARAEQFALDSFEFYRKLPKTPEAQVPGVQYYRAATSAWMNYRSSKRGRSRPEFISKLGIAVEEIDEACGWLEFMEKAQIAADKRLVAEARELCAILTSSLKTARANWKSQQASHRCATRRRSVLVKFPEPRF